MTDQPPVHIQPEEFVGTAGHRDNSRLGMEEPEMQPTQETLFKAKMLVDAGAITISERAAANLAKELVGLYSGQCRNETAKAAGAKGVAVLAGCHPSALDVVFEDVRGYLSLQRDVGDADSFHPNSIDVLVSENVLSNSAHCQRVVLFLQDMLREHCGLAQADVADALAMARGCVAEKERMVC
jgi:hypothetical protein